jgi:hypothetical protein
LASVEIPISRTKIVILALRSEILRRAQLLVHFDDLLNMKNSFSSWTILVQLLLSSPSIANPH